MRAFVRGALRSKLRDRGLRCTDDHDPTFAELAALTGGSDLRVFATNVTRRSEEVFSPGATPHIPVSLAVQASTALPLLFEPVRRPGGGDVLVDGGLVSNCPGHAFDPGHTLAFRLRSSSSTTAESPSPSPSPSPTARALATVRAATCAAARMAVRVTMDAAIRVAEATQRRRRSRPATPATTEIVDIDTGAIGALQLALGQPARQQLVEAGYLAASEHLTSDETGVQRTSC